MSSCGGDRQLKSSFERAVSPTRLNRWIKKQESMIDLAFRKADAAGDSAKGHELLQLAIRAQGELIALVAPKSAMKSKPPTKVEAEPDADDNDAAIERGVVPDLSQMSDEEVARLAGVDPRSKDGTASSATLVARERKPPMRRRRPKGHEVSGAAKETKEQAQERREREQREREAKYRYHPPRSHDSAIAWPAPTIPEEWEDDD